VASNNECFLAKRLRKSENFGVNSGMHDDFLSTNQLQFAAQTEQPNAGDRRRDRNSNQERPRGDSRALMSSEYGGTPSVRRRLVSSAVFCLTQLPLLFS
jgi:hypothetical protein